MGCSPGTAWHAADCCVPASAACPAAFPLPKLCSPGRDHELPFSFQGAGGSPCQSDRTQFPFSVSQAHSWGCAHARCLQREVSCWEQFLPLGWRGGRLLRPVIRGGTNWCWFQCESSRAVARDRKQKESESSWDQWLQVRGMNAAPSW